MDNFENDEWESVDFATGIKKEKPKDLYHILETTIDSMGIMEPAKKAAPMNAVIQADTYEMPEMAKPVEVDINKTLQDIGNLFTQHGQNEIANRHREFDRQQRSNQTFGFPNTDYSPSRDTQGSFMRTSGNTAPAATSSNQVGFTIANDTSNQATPAASEPFSWDVPGVAADTSQGAVMGAAVSGRARSQNMGVSHQGNTTTTSTQPQVFMSPVRRNKSDTPEVRPTLLPRVTLSPVQEERSRYIANRLIDEGGFTPEQAAGIVGNLIHESQLDHQARGPRHSRWGHPIGIAQWLHPDRKRKFLEEIGVDVSESTLEQQTDFLLLELKDKYKNAANQIRQAHTVNDATVVTSEKYEQAGREEARDDKRKAYGYQVYDRLP